MQGSGFRFDDLKRKMKVFGHLVGFQAAEFKRPRAILNPPHIIADIQAVIEVGTKPIL